MFYDVLQQLSFVVVKVECNKEVLNDKLQFVNVKNLNHSTNVIHPQTDDTLGKDGYHQDDYQVDLDMMLSHFGEMNKRVQLVRDMYQKSIQV